MQPERVSGLEIIMIIHSASAGGLSETTLLTSLDVIKVTNIDLINIKSNFQLYLSKKIDLRINIKPYDKNKLEMINNNLLILLFS